MIKRTKDKTTAERYGSIESGRVRMRIKHNLAAALFFLCAAAPGALAGDDLDTILEKVYSSHFEAQAEYDRYLDELVVLFRANRRSPAAAIIYNHLTGILPACIDPKALDGFFATLSEEGSRREAANGFLACRARQEHRKTLLRTGDYDKAAALDAFAPFAQKVLAIGPFGFEAYSLHDIAFPPEIKLENLDNAAGYAGDAEWKLVKRTPGRASIELSTRFYPAGMCLYALYQFNCPQKSPILLAFNSGASFKVWYNGKLVNDMDRRKAYLPRGIKIPLNAAQGWNRVLIKLSSGTSNFRLRITDRTGYPVDGLREIEENVLMPLGTGASGETEEFDQGLIDALSFLKSHISLHADKPFAAVALAETLALRGLDPEAVAMGERALELAPENAHVNFSLGALYTSAGYLPRNHKTNRAGELFKKAMEIDPGFLPAGLALALNDHRNDRSEKAVRTIRTLLKSNPEYYKAWLNLAAIFDELGWTKEFIDATRQAMMLARTDPEPVLLLAGHFRDIDRNDLAHGLYKKAHELDKSSVGLLERLAGRLWDRGEAAEAFGLYERILSLSNTPLNRERLAGLHHALGDPVKAAEIFTELYENNRRNPRYTRKLGDLALAGDDIEKAANWFKKALSINPGMHHIREILELWRVAADPVFQEFSVNESDYTRNLPGKEEFPRASALCSLDHMITRVYADGSQKSEIFQVTKILDKAAVEEYGRITVPGRIETLKVIRPNGDVLEPVDAGERGTFSIPGLDIGSVLVMRFTLLQKGSWNGPMRTGRFYFQDMNCSTPFLFSRYVIAMPKGLDLKMEKKLPHGFEEEIFESENETIHVFTARDVPVAEPENRMPPDEEVFPNVDFYRAGNWTRAAQLMADSLLPALKLTPELRNKAEDLCDGADDDIDKAKRIYAFVNEHVKEGSGSSLASSVLLERRGSRAALFMALADAAGVDHDYLRCGYKPGLLPAPMNWSDVSENLLPKELVRIPLEGKDPVFLSFSSRLTPFGEIPHVLFDAPAMKVTGVPERIEILPGGNPSSWQEEVIELKIKVDFLDAAITGKFTLPGYSRIQFKENLQRLDSSTRRRVFDNILRYIFPGAAVKKLKILGIDDEEHDPTFGFELEKTDFIHKIGEKLGCKLLPVPLKLTQNFIRGAERKFTMIHRGYSTRRFIIDIDLGGEYEPIEIPDSMVKRRFFLNYSIIIKKTEKGLRIERTADFMPADVEPADYPRLAELLLSIDEREAEPIILEKTEADEDGSVEEGL